LPRPAESSPSWPAGTPTAPGPDGYASSPARPVLVLDDLAMRELTPTQADDLYELINERAGRSLILTSNRVPVKAHLFARTCARRRVKPHEFRLAVGWADNRPDAPIEDGTTSTAAGRHRERRVDVLAKHWGDVAVAARDGQVSAAGRSVRMASIWWARCGTSWVTAAHRMSRSISK
jgi:hypothetical protein